MTTFSKDDFGDFEAIPAVASKAIAALSNGELTFAFPEVLEVIQLCSVNQIAVLGVELFKVREDGLYQTEKLTDYDLRMKQDPATHQEWPEYVRANNTRAEEFVKQNPAGDDHVYVLTTSSWRELGRIKELKKMR